VPRLKRLASGFKSDALAGSDDHHPCHAHAPRQSA
jgi:hypothetical protein